MKNELSKEQGFRNVFALLLEVVAYALEKGIRTLEIYL